MSTSRSISASDRTKSRPRNGERPRTRSAPAVEPLPGRVMLSVTALFSLASGELRVTGDELDNVITVSRTPGGTILVNNGAVPIAGGTPTISNTAHFHLVGGDGNDAVTLDEANGPLPGAALFGGAGNDTLAGGSGFDFADGGAGSDTVRLGRADDEFQWNAGDGSDVVDGQGGLDSMTFNGNDLAEQFAMSDTGAGTPFHRVRFTRDVGGVAIDLGGIEHIHLNTLGGADAVTVNDQTATDVFAVFVDLSGAAGSGDGQADAVIVNGTPGDDAGQINAFGTRVDALVSLFPLVAVSGAEPASDTLAVNMLGGDDALDAASLPAGFIKLNVNAGAGNDTVIGSGGDDTFFWNPGDGSDAVEGEGGVDTLNFNGSADAENIVLSANGPHLLLTRDIDNVAMDVGGVEQVSVSAVNGGDNIVLNDLTGTAVTALKFRLSGLLVQDADHVTVNATSGADAIRVEGDIANGVTITGLAAQLRVVGTEGPVDSVAVNGLGGADTVDASDLASGAVGFAMDGGAGSDTLTASQGGDRINGGTETDTINVIDTAPGGLVTVLPSSGDDTVNVNTDASGTARVAFNATQRIGALNVGSGGTATLGAGGANVLTVSSLGITGSGRLDLTDNAMILDYAGATPVASIRALLASGFNGGAWNGAGLISSTAAARPETAIGFAEATDLFANFPNTFKGQAIDGTSVLLAHTLTGDTDLNGTVNLGDFNRLAASFGRPDRRWSQGDFDYNGTVNLADFNRLAGNFGRAAAAATAEERPASLLE